LTKNLFVILLFLAPTIQYRVELGGFSFALMEPVVLVVSIVLLANHVLSRRQLVVVKGPLVSFFCFITLWASIVRPWAYNWQNGFSDIRDWAIPLLGFVTILSTVRRGWGKLIALFVVLVWLYSLLGIYQHLTDGFRPFISETAGYKTSFSVSEDNPEQLSSASFAAGFFSHPNSFAMYLYLGLMMGLGWVARGKKWYWKAVLLTPIVLSIVWSYAKASVLVMGFTVVFFILLLLVKSNRVLLAALTTGLFAAAVGIWQIVKYVPPALLATFWWRVGLWNTALSLMGGNNFILLLGNGLDSFANNAYYGQPHNLFLYLVLQYGFLGLIWALALGWYLLGLGWRLRSSGTMRSVPEVAALWIALIGYFAIGFVESNMMGIENRMIFFTISACFVGLAREVAGKIPIKIEKDFHVQETIAGPRPV
jgi:hypothetical protein